MPYASPHFATRENQMHQFSPDATILSAREAENFDFCDAMIADSRCGAALEKFGHWESAANKIREFVDGEKFPALMPERPLFSG